MKSITATAFALLAAASFNLAAAEAEEGFIPLMDGKTFNGWKTQTQNADTWKIEEGAFVTKGNMCHLFYVGEEKPFKNFELKVDVKTEAGSNGGIYFHTQYQERGWPRAGFESQVNNSHTDWIKTGSLYGLVNVSQSLAQDWQWWTQHIIVQGNRVTVKVNDKIVLEYHEPPGAQPGRAFSRKISEGTFALQAHDPKSVIYYKNIRVRRLE